MGDVAGSGGYYIAAAADKIVAEPATLTGSIGVVAGKVGCPASPTKARCRGMPSRSARMPDCRAPSRLSRPRAIRRFETFLDESMPASRSGSAKAASSTPPRSKAVAKGRIWTGEDAKRMASSMRSAAYASALALAKQEAGIPASSDVTVKVFPPPDDRARVFARLAGGAPTPARTIDNGSRHRLAGAAHGRDTSSSHLTWPPGCPGDGAGRAALAGAAVALEPRDQLQMRRPDELSMGCTRTRR